MIGGLGVEPRRIGAVAVAVSLASAVLSARAEETPLALETRIPLGTVSGRIDHLAYDPARRRLFVAELGNGSVGVVDVEARKVVHRIGGLSKPQGVGYVATTDTLYVANAGDGSVRIFDGARYAPSGRIDLGSDADNIRIDSKVSRLYVGHGDGGLAIVDLTMRRRIAEIALSAHPEGFALDPQGGRIFVNLPGARQMAVIDRDSARVVATWNVSRHRANFPMAFDSVRRLVLAGFRHPARLMAFRAADGAVLADVETCGDADDIVVDSGRDRVYVICGDGHVDVLMPTDAGYRRIGRIDTVPGARTALFVIELDRLFVAARASAGSSAAIWVLQPFARPHGR